MKKDRASASCKVCTLQSTRMAARLVEFQSPTQKAFSRVPPGISKNVFIMSTRPQLWTTETEIDEDLAEVDINLALGSYGQGQGAYDVGQCPNPFRRFARVLKIVFFSFH